MWLKISKYDFSCLANAFNDKIRNIIQNDRYKAKVFSTVVF